MNQTNDWWFIKRACESDVEKIKQVLKQNSLLPEVSDKTISVFIQHEATFVAIYESEIVGVILVHHETISGLCVSRDFRRRGIATELMKNAIEILNPKTIHLFVGNGNSPAINLYEKLGFFVTHKSNSMSMMERVVK